MAKKKTIQKKTTAAVVPIQPSLIPPPKITTVALRPNNTAAELLLITGKDDSFFRNHESKLRPDNTPYIPKAAGGRRNGLRAVPGLIELLEARSTDGLPRQLASMIDVEATFHIPKEVQQHFREKGLSPDAWTASNRVNILPLLKAIGALLQKILAAGGGHIKDIPGFEELDKDIMQARVWAQDEIRKKRENAQANRQIHTREEIEQLLGEPLSFLATCWKNKQKVCGTNLKSLLLQAGNNPDTVTAAIKILVEAVEEPINLLRENHHVKPKPDPDEGIEFFI